MLILSCDPGLGGALALICTRRSELLECADIPICSNGTVTGSMKNWVDVGEVLSLLSDWAALHSFAEEDVQGVIERPIPMPSLPAQTIASQFDSFGALRAVMGRYDFDLMAVNPSVWKRFFGLHSDKSKSREIVERLYPGTNYFKRKKDHDRAEAVLIGHWWRALHA